jgi:dipeptidyl aminopeptidase/acylaminoacyl peptidase
MTVYTRSLLLTLIATYALFMSSYAQQYKLEDVRNYPFPTALTSSSVGSRIAWAMDEQGKRNVYVAEAPNFEARKLTAYLEDDGQEISSLSLSRSGNWVVFVRGGDHGSNWNDAEPVNVNSKAEPPKVEIHAVSFDGKRRLRIGEGDEPAISPDGKHLIFLKKGGVWIANIDDATPAKLLFTARGRVNDLQWAPNGSAIAFVTQRQDHAFIGVYQLADSAVTWVAPSFHRDRTPRWSPDGKSLAFVRTEGLGGKPDPLLKPQHQPWSIWKVNLDDQQATELWKAPQTLAGNLPATHGGSNLHWAAKDRIIFVSAADGWSHLYSLPISGGQPILLTPGNFMVEHISLNAAKTQIYFSVNTGKDPKDIDRRHIASVPVDQSAMKLLSEGRNLEWTPVAIGDGRKLAFISSVGQQPPLPAVSDVSQGGSILANTRLLGKALISESFPVSKLVTPEQVIFNAPDGKKIHAQLFRAKRKSGKKPAIVYIHGGPSRQMLLGWNYSEYYSNAYATNQYLASLGFDVLSVNYRMGIGYGDAFQRLGNNGENGAEEYQDILAAGQWLAAQQDIDAGRIGVYGGSYGGYLTNMALAKDSKLFAAGVSIHSLSERTQDSDGSLGPNRFEKAPDHLEAAKVAWASSPIAHMATWTSPVLLIHGDDDRNVSFSHSVDLYRRLSERGVELETLVIPDDTHHWMKYGNLMKVNHAMVNFFIRQLKP